MARPIEEGLGYFPLNVNTDEKLDLIEAEFGLTGFGVIIKLYQWIYARGYYCEWTNEVALLFASKKCGLGGNVVSEITSAAIKRGIFDKSLYEKYHILTSRGIQKRYFEAAARRVRIAVINQYLLVSADDFKDNVSRNWVYVDINSENSSRNKQSKVKKSKVKESKESSGASAPPPAPKPDRKKYGKYGWVKLSDMEYERLAAEYGMHVVNHYVGVVDEKAQMTGNKNKWKDWNLTVRNAIRNQWSPRPLMDTTVSLYDDDDDFFSGKR